MKNKKDLEGDKIWFDTNSDRQAFLKVLTRSLYPVSKTAVQIQKCRTQTECRYRAKCTGKEADFIVTKKPEKEMPICSKCLEQKTEEWLEEQLETIKENLKEYRAAKKL